MKRVLLGITCLIASCGSDSPPNKLFSDPNVVPIPTKIAQSLNCYKQVVLSNQTITLNYNMALYTTNDRYVSCSASNGYGTYSNATVNPGSSASPGYANCTVVASIIMGNGGWWNFQLTNNALTAKYNDSADKQNNNYIYAFQSNDCSGG